ncbi:MAG TPA: NRDE family protein [Burkholderiales bacterium]|nr:NRDE family protein [Burkholderiales bacterium]
MCLIAVAWRAHPAYRLIVAANRDEYFRRPSAPADFWDDHRGVLAGRDLEAGGTWLGITLGGRFAALTNYRNPSDKMTAAPSRGALVSDFLSGKTGPSGYIKQVQKKAMSYNGFSLLVGNTESLWFLSNRGGDARRVARGIHGLSNHLLDTPWPKVERARAKLAKQLGRPFDSAAAFELLSDTERAPSAELPSTGVSVELEERLSAIRILAAGGYGTRCSTVLCFTNDGRVEFHERSYREDGGASGTVSYRLTLSEGQGRASSRRAGSRLLGTPLPAR